MPPTSVFHWRITTRWHFYHRVRRSAEVPGFHPVPRLQHQGRFRGADTARHAALAGDIRCAQSVRRSRFDRPAWARRRPMDSPAQSLWQLARRLGVVTDRAVKIRRLGEPGDLGWVVMAHGEIYEAEFGWDNSFEALIARIVADYAAAHDPAREAAWIAECDGERVGCVFCVAKDDTTAQLRILLVDPIARGLRLGARLVDKCIEFARGAGYERIMLWTNHPLVAAREIYLAAGFKLTSESPHHSFGVDLIGQTYELDLTADTSPSRDLPLP
jgi:GNAT superfamily N-acetyltransferase